MAKTGTSQGVRDAVRSPQASGARTAPPPDEGGIKGLIQRVLRLKPVRVFQHYSGDNGQLIASGMTYQAFFALAAALWLVFSLLGFVLNTHDGLRLQFFQAINGFLPHLVSYSITIDGKTDASSGVIDGSALTGATGLSIGTAISTVGVLLTAVGFLSTLRTAIRIMFALPGERTNPVLLKLKDLGLAVGFGAVVLLTAVLSLAANTSLTFLLGLVGLPDTSVAVKALLQVASIAVVAVIDTVVVAAILKILSGIPIPLRRLWQGALIAGVGLAVFEAVATNLLHLGTNNPALKTFATLIGVLVYFNLVCQILLFGASWVAVGMTDAHIDARSLSPAERDVDKAQRIEDARRLVADANHAALEQRVRAAHGFERTRLARELKREVRAEAQRRKQVPTTTEFEAAQKAADDTSPDTAQIARAQK